MRIRSRDIIENSRIIITDAHPVIRIRIMNPSKMWLIAADSGRRAPTLEISVIFLPK